MPRITPPSAPLTSTVDRPASSGKKLSAPAQTWGDYFEGVGFSAFEGFLKGLNASGLARPVLSTGLRAAAPGNDALWYDAMADHAATMLEAEHLERPGRKNFEERSREYLSEARVSGSKAETLTDKTAFDNPAFVQELEAAGGAQFSAGNSVEFLIDGPAAFAKRAELIENATESIHLLTWSIYDDATGKDLCAKLVRKAAEGVDVRVIVDRNISARSAHLDTLKLMEESGIKVIRWEDPEHRQYGNHCKVMIVDGTKAIAGGINPGNEYSHGWGVDPDYAGQKWRDTDVFVSGAAGVAQQELFVSYWNDQVQKQNLPFAPMSVDVEALQAKASSDGSSQVAVVDQKPDDENYSVLSTMMKAISGATKTIDIENAYFLNLPGMDQILMGALMRGVKVRIFTNSDKSVDEPLVSEPIMRSLPEFFEAGAEVYIKKGDTLHSKFLIVDDAFVSLGSLNLHPRSLYYDTEMAVNIIDPKAALALKASFDADVTGDQAIKIESLDDLKIESRWYNRFIKKYYFRHL